MTGQFILRRDTLSGVSPLLSTLLSPLGRRRSRRVRSRSGGHTDRRRHPPIGHQGDTSHSVGPDEGTAPDAVALDSPPPPGQTPGILRFLGFGGDRLLLPKHGPSCPGGSQAQAVAGLSLTGCNGPPIGHRRVALVCQTHSKSPWPHGGGGARLRRPPRAPPSSPRARVGHSSPRSPVQSEQSTRA